MSRFEEYCARGRAKYGERFVAPTGDRLIAAYNRGNTFRIEVDSYQDGKCWGYVSLTTGWVPSFMLMRTRRQTGSSHLLDAKSTIYRERYIA